MTKIEQLRRDQGQSAWLDNLTRGYLNGGHLQALIDSGICGVTSNPTILEKAITGSSDYDEQMGSLMDQNPALEDAFWVIAVTDVAGALELLRPVYDSTGGSDGFVSLELAPALAHDTEASIAAARDIHRHVAQPNLMVKIPATPEGVPAIEAMISEGYSVNITLIFSLSRYEEVIEAYLAGLERCSGDLSTVHSVASFFVSRVDTEVDQRLKEIGSEAALALRGMAAVAQAKLAYRLFRDRFSGDRWDALAARGARLQRPLWASTSTKDPAYPDLLYVDSLIGPDTVNTLPDKTIAAFEDHGTVARTIDVGLENAEKLLERLAAVGVDMEDVGRTLEDDGVAAFAKSFDSVLGALKTRLPMAPPDARPDSPGGAAVR